MQADRGNADKLATLLVSQARDLVVIYADAEGTIVGWSDGSERVLGYTAQEAIRKPLSVIFCEEDVAKGLPAQ
jgi:PAS domain S-box-containing protein